MATVVRRIKLEDIDEAIARLESSNFEVIHEYFCTRCLKPFTGDASAALEHNLKCQEKIKALPR